MNDKIKIIERLVKDGSIDLAEAFKLMESEKEIVYVQQIQPFTPIHPLQPLSPLPNPYTTHNNPNWWQFPSITCGLTVGENVIPLTVGNTIN